MAGPRQLPRPAADGPMGAGNPEGQRYLTDAMRVLRTRHVEFSHQAHHDLLAVRMRGLEAVPIAPTRIRRLHFSCSFRRLDAVISVVLTWWRDDCCCLTPRRSAHGWA